MLQKLKGLGGFRTPNDQTLQPKKGAFKSLIAKAPVLKRKKPILKPSRSFNI